MPVEFYKTLWGMGGTLTEKLARVKSQGYDGFEDWVTSHAQMRPAIDASGLKYMAMVPGDEPDAFRRALGEAGDCGAVAATVHVGRPWMDERTAREHLRRLVEISEQVAFPVNFETHRARFLFEPMSTARFLRDIPGLHLCADLSHWTVVTESMLGSYKEQLDLALSRTRHIHARVGFEEGPQVPDPRLPAWDSYVTQFEAWWDTIKAHTDKAGRTLTVDPEFGPPHYQWSHDGRALANIEDVALWMTNRLRERWKVS